MTIPPFSLIIVTASIKMTDRGQSSQMPAEPAELQGLDRYEAIPPTYLHLRGSVR